MTIKKYDRWNVGRYKILNCKYCNEKFKATLSNLKNFNPQYCSQKCYHSNTKHDRNKGKTWTLSEETKRKHSECQLKEKNHNWKGGITDERKSLEHSKLRNVVLKRDNYHCIVCLKKGELTAHNILGKGLDVHHLDGYSEHKQKRLEQNNCITLCKGCHTKFHSLNGFGKNTLQQFINWVQHEERKNN